ncbi:MAG: hypothetical protein JW915_06705 [Chitinispirillaceae bacterium]|nr:hypothetical protein [Chitinispirillaceae bacterium]
MKRLLTMLLVVSCSTLLMAAGSNGGSNGSQSNGENGQKESITGTIKDVMPQDSMLTVSKEGGLVDTVKVTDQTDMDMNLDELKSGDSVKVEYETQQEQKVATSIKMGTSNGDGSKDDSKNKDEKKDTSGMMD